jgi:hypothetical protein
VATTWPPAAQIGQNAFNEEEVALELLITWCRITRMRSRGALPAGCRTEHRASAAGRHRPQARRGVVKGASLQKAAEIVILVFRLHTGPGDAGNPEEFAQWLAAKQLDAERQVKKRPGPTA